MRALVLAIALVTCVTSGCFVADELDSGSKIMDQNARTKPGEPQQNTAASSSSGSKFLSGIDAGGQLQKMKDSIDEALAKPPDPDNTLVSCDVEGAIRYTRKYDCQALGGRLVMR
jgi:hypothetical protein